MILTVAERIALLSILPTSGDYVTLKILTQLRMCLSFTEDELKEWGIVEDKVNQRVDWEIDGVKEIPMGEVATGIIVDTLRVLDKKKNLTVNLFRIYEKFIPTT